MSRRTLVLWATIMVVVFTVTVIVYPLIFNPQNVDAVVPTGAQEVPLPSGPVGPGSPPALPPAK